MVRATGTPESVASELHDWNGLAAALITDFARIPEHQRNYVRMVFTDPAMRVLYPDWEDVARKAVTGRAGA
ncbi:hypothetical protein [Kutzneria buriramensis]|uniref:MmyB-like transcription regulator ligand binding domain-containing protein n=1 Tax=Kutzneria buriramensis TaxID=1045776 RepID=A0A3E0G7V3_9PSEU|nr:hypothetical protein [Kutzneria buriramensis]REH17897.1 hypothetical protein BCF44_14114 [Kutzneria buriramensis]